MRWLIVILLLFCTVLFIPSSIGFWCDGIDVPCDTFALPDCPPGMPDERCNFALPFDPNTIGDNANSCANFDTQYFSKTGCYDVSECDGLSDDKILVKWIMGGGVPFNPTDCTGGQVCCIDKYGWPYVPVIVGGVIRYTREYSEDYFCNKYHNAYCVGDFQCNRNSQANCLNDPDCWPADATYTEKQQICSAGSCMSLRLSTCVLNSGGQSCMNGVDYEGTYYDYYGKVSGPDPTLGCSLFGSDYECCIIDPDRLATRPLEQNPAWRIARNIDSACANGLIRHTQVDCDLKPANERYPCGEGSTCASGLDISSPPAQESDYERCWNCEEMCGVGECCNGVDDDGDGNVDVDDLKCRNWLDSKEGGVCFA